MKNLYEYSDRLNAPLVAFNHIASPDNFPILPHWHYFLEIIHILEGEVEAVCGNYVYIMHPGDIIIFFPQLIHSIYKGSAPVLKFDLNFLNINTSCKTRFLKIFELAYSKNPEYLYFSSGMLKDLPIYEIFNTCIEELDNKNYGYDVVVCSHISALLSYFARNWIGRGLDIDEAIRTSNNQSDAFAGITEYIEKHYNEPLRINELAEMCGMSYSNFARLFKQTYNQSCKEYIEFIRLNKVEDLLLMTNIDLTYISHETGFADCSHLIRTFKKWKGITPKQWRNKNEK